MQDNGGNKIQWTMGEIVSSAVQTFSDNWKPLVLSQVIFMGCIIVPMLVCGIAVGGTALLTHGKHDSILAGVGITAGVLTFAAIMVLLAMLGPASFRMVVAAVRGQKPQIADLFSRPFQRAGALVGASFLTAIVVMLGFILFIVPGIMLTFSLVMTHYFIIEDDSIDVVDAMQASRKLMYGHKWRYFRLMALFGFASMIVGAILNATALLFPVSMAFQLLSGLFGWLLVATLYARLRPLPVPLSQQQPVLSATA